MAKRYLGDGVYVDIDALGVVLTTENGLAETNRIVLDPDVLVQFFRYVHGATKGRILEAITS